MHKYTPFELMTHGNTEMCILLLLLLFYYVGLTNNFQLYIYQTILVTIVKISY